MFREALKIYFTCDNCKYTFHFDLEENTCPDCGSKNIRRATENEIKEHEKFKEETDFFYKMNNK